MSSYGRYFSGKLGDLLPGRGGGNFARPPAQVGWANWRSRSAQGRRSPPSPPLRHTRHDDPALPAHLLLILNALAFAAIGGWLGGECRRRARAGASPRSCIRAYPAGERTSATGLAPVAAEPPPPAAVVACAPSAPEATATRHPTPRPATLARACHGRRHAPAAQVAPSRPIPGSRDRPAAEPPAEACLVPAPRRRRPPSATSGPTSARREADRLAQRLRRIGITAALTAARHRGLVGAHPPRRNRSGPSAASSASTCSASATPSSCRESGPNQNAVSLGLFKTENRARILLGQLRARRRERRHRAAHGHQLPHPGQRPGQRAGASSNRRAWPARRARPARADSESEMSEAPLHRRPHRRHRQRQERRHRPLRRPRRERGRHRPYRPRAHRPGGGAIEAIHAALATP